MSIKLNAQSGGSVALDAPTQTTSSADVTLKLPVADGSADQVLKTDGSGNLGFTTPAAGITGADIWRITASIDMTTNFAIVQSNLSRASNSSSFTIGSGMTESSGIWTFPTTGLWMVRTDLSIVSHSGAVQYLQFDTYFSADTGSSYDKVARGLGNASDTSSYASMSTCCFVDVTNTSTNRLKFEANASTTNAKIYGESGNNTSTLTFIRLGDT